VAIGQRSVEDVGVTTPAFWSGKRVFVTGHTGFKGAWLCLWLERLGAEVTGFSLDPPTEPSLFEEAGVGRGLRSIEGDVRDRDAVAAALAGARPDIVVHMAAQSLVRRSFDQPALTYEVNVLGTVNVLDAVRHVPDARVAVNVSSDKCYENREWVWGYREHEPMGGHDPYSSSKGCAELVTAAYRASFFTTDGAANVGSARAGNVIGGGDWAVDRLVPDFARAALAGERLVVRNPASIRPWQHVLNPLSGYLALAEALWDDDSMAEGWNFGPSDDDVWPVERVANYLAAAWPGPVDWTPSAEAGPHEATSLRLDSAKARSRLDWRPRWDLEAALSSVVEWYSRRQAGEDVRELTLEQVDRFAAAA
jgi:CDP-glucose 4,6-dehydratase